MVATRFGPRVVPGIVRVVIRLTRSGGSVEALYRAASLWDTYFFGGQKLSASSLIFVCLFLHRLPAAYYYYYFMYEGSFCQAWNSNKLSPDKFDLIHIAPTSRSLSFHRQPDTIRRPIMCRQRRECPRSFAIGGCMRIRNASNRSQRKQEIPPCPMVTKHMSNTVFESVWPARLRGWKWEKKERKGNKGNNAPRHSNESHEKAYTGKAAICIWLSVYLRHNEETTVQEEVHAQGGIYSICSRRFSFRDEATRRNATGHNKCIGGTGTATEIGKKPKEPAALGFLHLKRNVSRGERQRGRGKGRGEEEHRYRTHGSTFSPSPAPLSFCFSPFLFWPLCLKSSWLPQKIIGN